MVAQLASFKFDDGLHDGILEQGIGTTAIEVKLAQCLAWGDQCPLYQIYVDLKKAYDVLDMERTLFFRRPMESGQGCCVSLLQKHYFWDTAKLEFRAWRNYRAPSMPRGALLHGGHFPLSCLMHALIS